MTAAPLRPARALLAAVVAASALLTGCLLSPNETRASRGMELALQDDSTFLTQTSKRVSRERAFNYARQLGVTRLRVNMLWAYTMPANVYNAPVTMRAQFAARLQTSPRAYRQTFRRAA